MRLQKPADITFMAWTYWDEPDHMEMIAGGIYSISTPSHGGIVISAARNSMIPAKLRNLTAVYEEDCNWAIPAIVFADAWKAYNPERFAVTMGHARATMLAWHGDNAALILLPQTQDEARTQARAIMGERTRSFETYGGRAPEPMFIMPMGDGWEVTYRQMEGAVAA